MLSLELFEKSDELSFKFSFSLKIFLTSLSREFDSANALKLFSVCYRDYCSLDCSGRTRGAAYYIIDEGILNPNGSFAYESYFYNFSLGNNPKFEKLLFSSS